LPERSVDTFCYYCGNYFVVGIPSSHNQRVCFDWGSSSASNCCSWGTKRHHRRLIRSSSDSSVSTKISLGNRYV